MSHPLHLTEVRSSLNMRWFLLGAWILIVAKCAAVAWAVDHWHVPFSANWVIIPTLLTAALATFLWFTRREK